jgi:hypothetical protein
MYVPSGNSPALRAENERVIKELKAAYGGGPIPLKRSEIEHLRELQKDIPPERRKELGGLDLDKDVIAVDDDPSETVEQQANQPAHLTSATAEPSIEEEPETDR